MDLSVLYKILGYAIGPYLCRELLLVQLSRISINITFSPNIFVFFENTFIESIKNIFTKENILVPGCVRLGTTATLGAWVDLNDGAGGPYIYLQGKRSANVNAGISNIAIISSTYALNSYSGWTLVGTDLNKGVGGKYIYLCYR
jgi:hypothetical protein